jgi:hypothetical protein
VVGAVGGGAGLVVWGMVVRLGAGPRLVVVVAAGCGATVVPARVPMPRAGGVVRVAAGRVVVRPRAFPRVAGIAVDLGAGGATLALGAAGVAALDSEGVAFAIAAAMPPVATTAPNATPVVAYDRRRSALSR